jgi:hypothetical protein
LAKNRDESTSANVKNTLKMIQDILKLSFKQNFGYKVKKDIEFEVYN